jgi:hypothetical protein
MHKHANESSRLFNVELSPETATGTWKTWNLFAWWMSGWHSLGGYTMAVGLFALGLSGYQMIAAFTAGIIILYFTNNMSGVAGQRVKVPFPVFARASFGVYGANIPAILRAIVAVAWYGNPDGKLVRGPFDTRLDLFPRAVLCAAHRPVARHGGGAPPLRLRRSRHLDRHDRACRMGSGTCRLVGRFQLSHHRA